MNEPQSETSHEMALSGTLELVYGDSLICFLFTGSFSRIFGQPHTSDDIEVDAVAQESVKG